MYLNSYFVCHTREKRVFFCLLQFICQYIFKEKRGIRLIIMFFSDYIICQKIRFQDS